MIPLNNIRRWGAIFFEIVSILIIAFYSSPEFVVHHQLTKNTQSFFQIDSGNPIVYKASENLSFAPSSPKIQAVEHSDWDVSFDVPSLELATSDALHVVASLHNVFYVFTSINAP